MLYFQFEVSSSSSHINIISLCARRLRRHHFELMAGKYLLPLCDQFTAGTIFDELTEDTVPIDLAGASVDDFA